MTSRRNFLKKAGAAGAAGAATIAAPAVHAQSKTKIKWRLQTYAGPALAEHVIKPSIDSFNKVANGEMEIELYFADQLVPTGELFRAMQRGTIDAVQSDDDSIAAPVDISVFGGYFPFATRYSLDVPALFHQWGLNEIWAEAYGEIEGVTWLSAGAWDPCHFNTVNPIRSLEDLKGLRVFTFPTAGRFLSRFGVVPGDPALGGHRGRGADRGARRHRLVRHHRGLHGGLGRRHQLLPHQQHLGRLVRFVLRQLREVGRPARASPGAVPAVHGQLALLPPVLVLGRRGEAAGGRHEAGADLHSGRGMGDGGAEAVKFWDEIAAETPRTAKVVGILRAYNAAMAEAGRPYRYT